MSRQHIVPGGGIVHNEDVGRVFIIPGVGTLDEGGLFVRVPDEMVSTTVTDIAINPSGGDAPGLFFANG